MNYYDLLEVSAKASPEVIKAAYKNLMQRYRPDKNHDDSDSDSDSDSAQRTAQMVQVYEVLSDETRRASHDRQMQSQAVLREVPRFPAASTLHRPATVASAKVHGDTLGYGLVWQTVLRMTTAHSPELASVVKHLEIDLPKNSTGGL